MKSNPLVLAGLALLAPAVVSAGGFGISEVDAVGSPLEKCRIDWESDMIREALRECVSTGRPTRVGRWTCDNVVAVTRASSFVLIAAAICSMMGVAIFRSSFHFILPSDQYPCKLVIIP